MARVHCWWWWLNGNATKAAITRDLEAMRDKGMGGANIIDAAHASSGQNTKPPHGPDFGSSEWIELFIHAVSEADRLGLKLGFNIQSGWNLGGPTVTPETASKEVVWSSQRIVGGEELRLELPQPRTRADYCVDIAALAVPLSGDGAPLARIDNYQQKSYRQYPGWFTAVDASHLLESTRGDGGHAIEPDKIVDLTPLLQDGVLRWKAPQGEWLVLRFAYTVAGARVSTSSDGWKGWAIDYLDPAAFDQYCEDVLDPILAEAEPYLGKSLAFLHTDSWELGPVNWTPRMPEQFLRLRGYDIKQYLPALAGFVVEDHETSNRFLNDFRRTLGDLIADGKYRRFADYAHAKGLGIHPESGGPHAAPVDALKCLGRSDIPMGEFWARSRTHRTEDTSRLFVKQAASAAHVYGKRLVMAEAFTTIGPHWERDPRDLKPVFDRVACEGLNLVMWHTFDCSPVERGLPGDAYFAGTHLNPNVTWWDYADGFVDYMNRCQFMLQQGLPVSDVLYFYGENVPSFVRLKRDDPAGVHPRYDYDVINLEALVERAAVEEGRLVLPDGVSYAALVLPPPGHYGLAALEKIAQLADDGALVIGDKPSTPYGLADSSGRDQRFSELADALWRSGRIETLAPLDTLRKRGIEPDFDYHATADSVRLDYFHRRVRLADGSHTEVYFVVNRRGEPVEATCSFRVEGKQPEFWDPLDGSIESVHSYVHESGRTVIPLEIPGNGSVFVVFREEGESSLATVRRRPFEVARLDGPWRVTFDPNRGGPGEIEFRALHDWVASDDDRIKHYSGAASYERSFILPEDYAPGSKLWIDLGEVYNLARVYVNDTDLGVVWTPPLRVEVSAALREGENSLRIDVVNLWANRLIGDAKLPPGKRITKTNIRKFTGDHPLMSSGLLGPVTLHTESGASGVIVSTAQRENDKQDAEKQSATSIPK